MKSSPRLLSLRGKSLIFTRAKSEKTGAIKFLDLRHQHAPLDQRLQVRLDEILKSSAFLLGPNLSEFEELWARYCEVNHAIGVGNGLDALHLTLRALDIGPGDEVLVPDNTFIATWIAVSLVGASVVPIAHDPDTFNIDPDAVLAAIGPRTRAIIAVHLYGQPADLTALSKIAAEKDVFLLEDAAQAHGATLRGKRIGGHSTAAVWSFYPGKNLGAIGDAGGITTNDEDLARRLRSLRNYGSATKGYHESLGINSRMDEIQAAVLSEKLNFLDQWNAQRFANAETYLSSLSHLLDSYDTGRLRILSLPKVLPGTRPVWHQFVIRVTHRDEFQSLLLDSGIETSIHYPVAPSQQMAYQGLVKDRRFMTSDESFGDKLLSLPIGPHLSEPQILRVCNSIERIIAT